MKQLLCLGIWLSSCLSTVAQASTQASTQVSAQVNSPATCRAQLANRIEAITDSPDYQDTSWGILVQTLEENPQTVYAQNPNQRLIPASNVKLLTTAAALTELGSEFQIRTSVYQTLAPNGDITLRVVGRGDPSFSNPQLQALARQVADRGIRQVNTLIADDQYFHGVFVNPTWEAEDIQAGYGAPLNSLILNQNAIGLTLIPQALGQPLAVRWDHPSEAKGWRVANRSQTVAANADEFLDIGRDLRQPVLYVRGQLRAGSAPEPVSVSIPEPSQNFLAQFQATLVAQQIQVEQALVARDATPPGREIAAVESPRLSELLVETNQQSNNLYAEALLRQLGVKSGLALPLAAGINSLRQSLTQLGVDPNYALADGSGLSRQNLASPQVFVDTLQAMTQSADSATYRNSLSTAGMSGTLQNRFNNMPVQGHFQGKTGFMSGVAALSGYLTADRPLAVSILANQPRTQSNSLRAGIDAIVEQLYQHGSCES
jgi:serine-type D-Ala-D-Ala carboxypeptidase/endopeptidase (penicillin-binding protein 4)